MQNSNIPSGNLISPQQYYALTPTQQAQYIQSLSAPDAAAFQTNLQQYTRQQNVAFMRESWEQLQPMYVQGSSQTTATYGQSVGAINFDFPTVGGFAIGIIVTFNISVRLGTNSAGYNVNAAAPFNLFSVVQIQYNGYQHNVHPYVYYLKEMTRGYGKGSQNRVIAGNNDTTIAQNVVGTTAAVIPGTTQTWQGHMFIPLTALSREDPRGVLPLQGVGNKPRLILTCNPAFIGQDPLLNCVSPTSGASGSAITTLTGNVNADVVYLGGMTSESPAPLSLQWQTESTIQYYQASVLTPFNTGSPQSKTINIQLKHHEVYSLVIDGAAGSGSQTGSTQFMQYANLYAFKLCPDEAGTTSFMNFGFSNNLSIYDFYDRLRRILGQDLPPGVIPWVMAQNRGVVDASNRNGRQALNMYPGGYPAATTFYQLNSYSAQAAIDGFAACTPRVETFLVSENMAGLVVG